MTITEKVSYLRGLAQGLELDESQKEVKLISAIINVLDDMALTFSDLEEGFNNVSDQLDAVDEDLYNLEEDVYNCNDEDPDDELYCEVTCPTCNETVCLSEDMVLKGEINCPNCGEKLEFDFDDVCFDDCDCGCDCSHDTNNK